MTTVAVIPARGGSKGIIGKNLRRVGGRSLLGRSILGIERTGLVDVVLVSTDDEQIAAEAERYGAEVVVRPAALASDEASSEAALLHAIDVRSDVLGGEDDVLVFVQCTSPFLDTGALSESIRTVRSGGADVSFSVVESHAFIWATDDEGQVRGVNHDHRGRLRRQERQQEFQETGAFYVMRSQGFVESKHRFFGSIAVQATDPRFAIEIDDPSDLEMSERLAMSIDPLGVARLSSARIDALVMDFDGVHTDNTAIVTDSGRESARVSRLDGMGVSIARKAGLPMLILSKETNPIVEHRAAKLGIECISSCDDKLPALKAWLSDRGIAPEHTVYVGNDVNDVECLDWVGWPVIVADSHPSLCASGALMTYACGGAGAVREVIDSLMKSGRRAGETK